MTFYPSRPPSSSNHNHLVFRATNCLLICYHFFHNKEQVLRQALRIHIKTDASLTSRASLSILNTSLAISTFIFTSYSTISYTVLHKTVYEVQRTRFRIIKKKFIWSRDKIYLAPNTLVKTAFLFAICYQICQYFFLPCMVWICWFILLRSACLNCFSPNTIFSS